MRKLIDIPEENKVLEKLQILAVKAKKDLKNYIQDLLIEHVKIK
jgi:endonuclease YncB( thermonuclease family)